jgi:hypothetical protein
LEAVPLGIGKVAWIGSTHARQYSLSSPDIATKHPLILQRH